MNQITVWTGCAIDEGGPLGTGFQEQAPNHLQACCGKELWWCCVMKTRRRRAVRKMKEDWPFGGGGFKLP